MWRRIATRSTVAVVVLAAALLLASQTLVPALAATVPTAFPAPPRGGMTVGISGSDDPSVLAAAQAFDVESLSAFDIEAQRWFTYIPGAPAWANTLGVEQLSPQSVVFAKRSESAAPLVVRAVRPLPGGDLFALPLPVPPGEGLTVGLSTVDVIADLISAQRFEVATVLAWDIRLQRYLTYVVGAPAWANSLSDAQLKRTTIVWLKSTGLVYDEGGIGGFGGGLAIPSGGGGTTFAAPAPAPTPAPQPSAPVAGPTPSPTPSPTPTPTPTPDPDPANVPPVANDDAATAVSGVAVTINVLANDTDSDGGVLSVTTVSVPSNGVALDNGDGTVTYTSGAAFAGDDSFTYTVSDGQGGEGTATVTITVSVSSSNTPPIANDDAETAAEDSSVTIDLLANDIDADGDALIIASVTQPAAGTVTNNGDGTVTYTPDANFSGVDSFTYTVSDGRGGEDTATVTITVNGVNDAPIAADDSVSTTVGNPVSFNAVANDSDVDGDTLFVQSFAQPANGTVTNDGGGLLTYTPNESFAGADSFVYTVSDGAGGAASATVTVTVSQIDTVQDGVLSTSEDQPVTVVAIEPGSDVTLSAITQGQNGVVTDNGDGTITYTPNPNFNGTDQFSWTITFSFPGSATTVITVNVQPVNDAPQAVDDQITIAGGTVVISVLSNDTDPDGDAITLTSVSQPSTGTAVANADGTVTYSAPAGFSGIATFTYTISDPSGASASATVQVRVG